MQIVSYILKVFVPAIIVVALAFLLMKIVKKGIKNLSSKKNLPKATSNMLDLLARWVIVIGAILIIASIVGIELTALWAGVAALVTMAAIGFFAGWSLISSILAAIIIMIWQPYKVGNKIEILPDGIQGKVIFINMMFSILEDDDNNKFSIPNSQMLQKIIKKLPS